MKFDKQKLLIRLHPYKGWCLILGETVALIAAALAVIPGVPDKISENAVAWAIMFGAGALLLVAVFEKFDVTSRPIVHLSQDEFSRLERYNKDVIYITTNNP